MKTSGWILMSISWVSILGLAMFCFSRIFANRRGKKMDNPVRSFDA